MGGKPRTLLAFSLLPLFFFLARLLRRQYAAAAAAAAASLLPSAGEGRRYAAVAAAAAAAMAVVIWRYAAARHAAAAQQGTMTFSSARALLWARNAMPRAAWGGVGGGGGVGCGVRIGGISSTLSCIGAHAISVAYSSQRVGRAALARQVMNGRGEEQACHAAIRHVDAMSAPRM